jgi:hypothetical protein
VTRPLRQVRSSSTKPPPDPDTAQITASPRAGRPHGPCSVSAQSGRRVLGCAGPLSIEPAAEARYCRQRVLPPEAEARRSPSMRSSRRPARHRSRHSDHPVLCGPVRPSSVACVGHVTPEEEHRVGRSGCRAGRVVAAGFPVSAHFVCRPEALPPVSPCRSGISSPMGHRHPRLGCPERRDPCDPPLHRFFTAAEQC